MPCGALRFAIGAAERGRPVIAQKLGRSAAARKLAMERRRPLGIQLDFLRSQPDIAYHITTRAGALTNLPQPWQGGLHECGMWP
jgi:hypothetical protein